jgi:AmmeMemoRadiSam system protein A
MSNLKDIYSENDQNIMLKAARSFIKSKLKKEKFLLDLNSLPENFLKIRSCFVTLHSSNNMLRGCIGHIEPFEYLIDNIKHNAINAAFNDPRFPAIFDLEELKSIKIEISILTVPEKIDSYEEIEIGKHGIILNKSGYSSVFLPQVALEQGWDLSETLMHLSLKAGLSCDDWKDSECKFKIFEATYFKER